MRRSLPEVLASLICNLLMLAAMAWIAYQILRLVFKGIKLLLSSLNKYWDYSLSETPKPTPQQEMKTSDLKTPIHVSRNGIVIHENIDDAEMRRLIRIKAVTTSDHYFRQGMTDWLSESQYLKIWVSS